MPWCASTSDQARARAIWPTAAAAWLSSSFSAPGRQSQHGAPERDRAGRDDEHLGAARVQVARCPRPARRARRASARLASRSTSSAEPILTTMRRKLLQARATARRRPATSSAARSWVPLRAASSRPRSCAASIDARAAAQDLAARPCPDAAETHAAASPWPARFRRGDLLLAASSSSSASILESATISGFSARPWP